MIGVLPVVRSAKRQPDLPSQECKRRFALPTEPACRRVIRRDDADMATNTLGENGSLVLPEALRNGLHLDRGGKLEAAVIGDPIELKPCGKAAPASWPPGFFDRIAIDDPAFARPPQGTMPAGVEL